jgi:uncharacterized protein YdaU (DUF1376 family)
MPKLPYIAFYPGDWLKDPQLRMTSPATRGIWIDLLCHMWEAPQRGIVVGSSEQLARLCSCSQSEFQTFLAEAEQLAFADVQHSNDGIVTLANRRMVRDEKARKDAAKRQARFKERHRSDGEVTAASYDPSAGSSSAFSSSKINKGAAALGLETPSITSKRAQAQAVLELWNAIVTRLPKARELTDTRIRWIAARLCDYSLEQLRDIFCRLDASDFAAGANWASFDWIIKKPDHPLKVLEGNYDNKPPLNRNGAAPTRKPPVATDAEYQALGRKVS